MKAKPENHTNDVKKAKLGAKEVIAIAVASAIIVGVIVATLGAGGLIFTQDELGTRNYDSMKRETASKLEHVTNQYFGLHTDIYQSHFKLTNEVSNYAKHFKIVNIKVEYRGLTDDITFHKNTSITIQEDYPDASGKRYNHMLWLNDMEQSIYSNKLVLQQEVDWSFAISEFAPIQLDSVFNTKVTDGFQIHLALQVEGEDGKRNWKWANAMITDRERVSQNLDELRPLHEGQNYCEKYAQDDLDLMQHKPVAIFCKWENKPICPEGSTLWISELFDDVSKVHHCEVDTDFIVDDYELIYQSHSLPNGDTN